MDLGLGGKRAIVTGGGGGLGREIALALTREGAAVALAGRTLATLERVADELGRQTGELVLAIPVDTRQPASITEMADTAVSGLGGIDILVNCASRPGVDYLQPKTGIPVAVDEALMQEDIDVKVFGYLRCIRAVLPHMLAQRSGRIINISGLSARRTSSVGGSVRNVAVAAMSKNIADEVGLHGIGVVVVHPGLTRTAAVLESFEQIATSRGITAAEVEAEFASGVSIGRLPTAGEVAAVVAFLCSPLSASINGDAVACGGGDRRAIHY